MNKSTSNLVLLTFLLVLGLYGAGIYFYVKNKTTIEGASNVGSVLGNIVSIFKGKGK